MKHIAISALVCGTVLILAPIIHDLISLAMLAHLLTLNPAGDFRLNGTLNNSYQGWCLFIGVCLLITGTVFGFRSRSSHSDDRASGGAHPSPIAASSNA